jgi:hypothetical protein
MSPGWRAVAFDKKQLVDDHAFTRRAHGIAQDIAAMPPFASRVATIEQLSR